MKARRLHILSLLLIATCLRVVCAQEAVSTVVEETVPISQVDAQLRLYKTALLENPTPKNRVDAASLLLVSENPEARKILLDVLALADNPAARTAVCEALSPMKLWQTPIKNKEDFIKPLIGVIASEEKDVNLIKLAAEALLVFGYSQVQMELEKAVTDSSLPVIARTNVIYAMRRHPDKQAVIKLFSLLDSGEPPIVDAARTALASVGVTVSSDPAVRRQTLLELQQRGAEVFLRERVIRQETRIRENESERDNVWKKYLADKTTLYNLQGTEDAKVKFLATHLAERENRVKLWALDRLEELRVGTSKAKFSSLEPVLKDLISDSSRDVRLSTARRLASLWELNVAKPLLDQLNLEQDEQVRREILVALREACYTSLGDTAPGPRIPDEIRAGTLAWGVRFLNEADPEKARVGADVIGKLLEPKGMKPEEVDNYLATLAQRYARMNPANDVTLRGYLLSAMAGLCSSRSACREQAAKLFGPAFDQALADKTESIRLVAMDGVVNANADKLLALRKLRKDLAADPSVKIRLKLVDLAGDEGGQQELDWLAEKLGVADENEKVWNAMIEILQRSPTALVADWVVKIKSPEVAAKLTSEKQISFFAMARQKAQSENKADLLKEAQTNLADLYIAAKSFKEASDCLRGLIAAGTAGQELARFRGQLLQVYLELGNAEAARTLISNYLSEKDFDLSPEGNIAKCIEVYLGHPTAINPGELLESLQQVQVADPQVRQMWQALLSRWAERYAQARKTGDGESASN
jgi:hypothetical protein